MEQGKSVIPRRRSLALAGADLAHNMAIAADRKEGGLLRSYLKGIAYTHSLCICYNVIRCEEGKFKWFTLAGGALGHFAALL